MKFVLTHPPDTRNIVAAKAGAQIWAYCLMHLWQLWFGSVAMDEEHLIAAIRYVSLNPVRVRAHLSGRDDGVVTVAAVTPLLRAAMARGCEVQVGTDMQMRQTKSALAMACALRKACGRHQPQVTVCEPEAQLCLDRLRRDRVPVGSGRRRRVFAQQASCLQRLPEWRWNGVSEPGEILL
jgi:hypothetical protein